MVDTAFLWIGLMALVSAISAVAFGLYYIQTRNYDYFAFGFAVVWIAGVIELSMANGYLPENLLFNALVGVCVSVAVVTGGFGIATQGRGFQLRKRDAQ